MTADVACAVNRNHPTKRLWVSFLIDNTLWRIPVWVCVHKGCARRRGAYPLNPAWAPSTLDFDKMRKGAEPCSDTP